MVYGFVPDSIKLEEMFCIEAPTADEALALVDKEVPCNCVYSVWEVHPFSMTYVGHAKTEEGERPLWVPPPCFEEDAE